MDLIRLTPNNPDLTKIDVVVALVRQVKLSKTTIGYILLLVVCVACIFEWRDGQLQPGPLWCTVLYKATHRMIKDILQEWEQPVMKVLAPLDEAMKDKGAKTIV